MWKIGRRMEVLVWIFLFFWSIEIFEEFVFEIKLLIGGVELIWWLGIFEGDSLCFLFNKIEVDDLFLYKGMMIGDELVIGDVFI